MTSKEVTTAIPLPSADLINYRFDMTDKKFVELSAKLDLLTNTYLTKDEAQSLKEERDEKIANIQRQLDADRADRRWKSRMLTTAAYTALLLSLGTAIVSLIFGAKP